VLLCAYKEFLEVNMRDYKTPILIGSIYTASLFILPIVRTITAITLIFLVLHFSFHGILGLLGKRAEKLQDRFVETHLATVLLIGMYGISSIIYFATT
jgi:hypothetical protein